MVNRVITVGERAGWGSSDGGPGSAAGGQRRLLPERWVQFGSAAAAQVAVEEVNIRPGAEVGAAPAAGRTLRAYLAVPPEQYSLLDPKWIQRCGNQRSQSRERGSSRVLYAAAGVLRATATRRVQLLEGGQCLVLLAQCLLGACIEGRRSPAGALQQATTRDVHGPRFLSTAEHPCITGSHLALLVFVVSSRSSGDIGSHC